MDNFITYDYKRLSDHLKLLVEQGLSPRFYSALLQPLDTDSYKTVICEIIPEVKSQIRRPVRYSPVLRSTLSHRKYKAATYRRNQELYKDDICALVDILKKDTGEGLVSVHLNDIHNKFDVIFDPGSPTVDNTIVYRLSKPADIDVPMIYCWEVEKYMLSISAQSSPGPDGVTVDQLRISDTAALAALYSNFLFFGSIPSPLKQNITTFIPKSETVTTADDVRPLTLSSVVYRLFSKIINNRLRHEIKLSSHQLGFTRDSNTHVAILGVVGAILRNRLAKSDTYIAALDVSKAFDSVPHAAILESLCRQQASPAYITVIRDAYDGCTTTFSYDGKKSSRVIRLRQGTKQGDPLSPLLFNLTFNAVVEAAASVTTVLAYADDLLLLAGSELELNSGVDAVVTALAAMNMKLNTTKCQFVGFKHDEELDECRKVSFQVAVGAVIVPCLPENTWLRYLGVDINILSGIVLPWSSLRAAEDLLEQAALEPFQRWSLLMTCFVPAFLYALKVHTRCCEVGLKLDRHLRMIAKKWMHLPENTPIGYFHLRTSENGLGCPQAAFRAGIGQLQTLVRLRNSGSAFLRSLYEDGCLKEQETCLQMALRVDPQFCVTVAATKNIFPELYRRYAETVNKVLLIAPDDYPKIELDQPGLFKFLKRHNNFSY